MSNDDGADYLMTVKASRKTLEGMPNSQSGQHLLNG
jgi:hypothetical protein